MRRKKKLKFLSSDKSLIMQNKIYKVVLLLLCGVLSVGAQSPTEGSWTLEQCIEHALTHNLSLKRQALQANQQELQLRQAKLDRLPNLNANSSFRTSSGSVRIESTFELVDMTTRDANLGLSSSTPLFEGFTRRNAVHKARTDFEAAKLDVEKAGNDLALGITAMYMQILFDREMLETARAQEETVRLQVEQSEKLVAAGRLPEGSLLEMQALAARESSSVIQLENRLLLSLLDLAQALDLEDVGAFDVVYPEVEELSSEGLQDASSIYALAVGSLPRIAASELRLESSQKQVDIAKGYLWPRLSFNTGWSTYVTRFKGQQNFDFGQSFSDNASQYWGLSLNIPIFNALSARNNIKNARLGVLNAQYSLEQEQQLLRKDIQQALADAQAAYRQFLAGEAAVNAYREAFRYTEKRYEVGMVNVVDYQVSKTELLNAESDYLQAKYTFLLRSKILDFYQGRPLVL